MSRAGNRDELLEFRRKATLGVAILGVLILSPFAFNNFFQHRPLLGAGSLAIVLILAWNAWHIRNRGYSPWLILFGLVPLIIVFIVLALGRQGIIGALWCYPAVLAFYMMLPQRKAWIANVALLVIAVPQAWLVLPPAIVIRIAATLVAVNGFTTLFIRVITTQQKRLQILAETDPLTGLYNRKNLRDKLEQAIARHAETGAPISLLALDLDHFKAINDERGHDAGDVVLSGMGELLREHFADIGVVFRTGGEEFLMLLPNFDDRTALKMAEKIRMAIESQSFLDGLTVTASIGVAVLGVGESRMQWMKHADDNLYRAKIQGRNRSIA